jgi:glutamyl endopeptidase
MRTLTSWRALATAAASALVGGLLLTAPAHAAPEAVDLNAPVASDGTKVSTPEVVAHGQSSFTGSGVTKAQEGLKSGAKLFGPESIYGSDNRIRINPTTSFPARATVMITRNGNAHCTGWMYGPDVVATAGHCLHSGGSNGSWYTGLVAWPGRNGTSAPYGGCTEKAAYSVVGWTQSGSSAYDYGVLKLNCTIGNNTGWFGYWYQSAGLRGLSTFVQGYPGEKPFGEQWRGDNVSRVVQESNSTNLWYNNDTTPGMSGAPVWQARPNGPYCTGSACVMGVHAYSIGGSSYPSSSYNMATRITEARAANLQAWRAAS